MIGVGDDFELNSHNVAVPLEKIMVYGIIISHLIFFFVNISKKNIGELSYI